MNILQAIGNTSMVRLRKVVPPGCADIFVKLELENPTGSMKDRMALAVISRAEEDGRLRPGDTVVEYTGGSTGASLALVCAAKGLSHHSPHGSGQGHYPTVTRGSTPHAMALYLASL
jgi:cysteine synthase